MASNFQKFLNEYTKHAVAGSSKLLATLGGAHIYNIQIDKDMDNGTIVAKGDIVDAKQEVYAVKESTGFAGKIIGKAANGNWYVEVVTPGDALLMLQVPLLYEEYTRELQHESQFYNENGDIVRCYELRTGDVFELSAEGFDSGTPEAGKDVTVTATTCKLTVAA